MRKLGLSAAALATLLAAAPARAQLVPSEPAPEPAPPPPPPPAPPVPPAMPAPMPVPAVAVEAQLPPDQIGRHEDPHIDRGFINLLSPTAETQPRGSFSFNDSQLILLGLTYGATDNLQLSFMTLAPIFEDMPFFGIFGAKWQAVRAGRVHLAAVGNLFYASADGESGSAGLLGGAASVCLDPTCASLASGRSEERRVGKEGRSRW